MLQCFIDYIGLNHCVGVYGSSPSGHYMNSLPGLTWANIDGIADEEQRTWEGVYADVQNEAKVRFYTDILGELNACYALNKECDYEALICDDANMVLLTNAWKYLLGTQIMIERLYSPRLNRYTLVDHKQAAELRDFYQVTYENALKQAVLLMDTEACELCCEGSISNQTYLP